MYRFFLAETQALRVTWAMLLLLFGLVLGTWRDVCLGSEGGLDALWALSLRPHPTPARASVEHAHAPPFPQPLVRDQGGPLTWRQGAGAVRALRLGSCRFGILGGPR